MRRAFTLVELLVIMMILIILVGSARFFSDKTIVSAEFNSTVSDIRQSILTVNNRALESYKNEANGIRFESNQYTIFVGTSFNPYGKSNQVFSLDSSITISNINFSSNPDLIFTKATGVPVSSGSFDITSNRDHSVTISVDANGVTSVTYN